MKAILWTQYGSPHVLQLGEVKKPVPKDDELLLRVHAASINSWDWDLLRGRPFVNRIMFGLFKPKIILGCDVAGRVESIGNKVKKFKPGDAVFGDLSSAGWGGFAQYVCAPEKALTEKPECLTFEQAAAVPQAALLALQGLSYKGGFKGGQKILINGAGGGAGTFAIQIAKTRGAEVTAVDGTEKLMLMQSLGADHVIDYTTSDFTASGMTYDFILDVMAHHKIFDYKRALKPGGTYCMMGGDDALVWRLFFLGPWISIRENKKMGLLLHKANRDIEELIQLLEAGKVIPIIDRIYSLSETAEAFRYFGEGNIKGKVIITMKEYL